MDVSFSSLLVAGFLALIFVEGKILNVFLLQTEEWYSFSFATFPSLTTDYLNIFIGIGNAVFVFIVQCETGGKNQFWHLA